MFMQGVGKACPSRPRYFSPSACVLLVVAAGGLLAGVYRFGFGLRESTNLDHFFPWGLWIVADVSFIALAAGGFVTAAIAHVFHRERYHSLARPALLTALLGYTFACVLLAADLGKYYNIWHPILPSMWQGNSALFEVGMCVMTYLAVLYVEFLPVLCGRLGSDAAHPRLARLCTVVDRLAGKSMCFVFVLGVAVSCLHQSSLGHIFVLAPTKLHPLWWTPILSLLFLLSAVMAGVPTVMFVCICAARALGVPAPMRILSRLATYVSLVIAAYLAVKIGDLLLRGVLGRVFEGSVQSLMFGVEIVVGLVLPLTMMISRRVRESPRYLASASLFVMLGVAVNRANVYWIGFRPVAATHMYVPSIAEWLFTIGMLAALVLVWKVVAFQFPIVTWGRKAVMS